ncbi:MAG TPA: glycerol-3-phosphate acyltransferase [Acidimicrobiales bacterium]|nr:glycerol-3-phosphate acyltransferase [Acidimicrobiales bacterium]
MLGAAYLAGSVPVANLVARRRAGTDLREVGSGTVSGSALYAVTGFGPLALAGCVELAKGATGPLLAGRERPLLGATSAAAAVVGHNWSPWLGGRGGRGVSLLLGAGLVLAPEGTALLGLGLGLGRIARRTGAGTFVALVLLPLLLWRSRGRHGALAGAILVAPVLVKRLVGDDGRLPATPRRLLRRLVADADEAPAR